MRPVVGGIVGEGIGGVVDGDYCVVGADEVLAGDVEGMVADTLGAEVELDGAELALAVTVAGVTVTGEAHGHGTFTGEGDEAEAVGDELVVEDGGVDLDLYEVDGDGGDLGDHDAAEGVGHAGVGVAELELCVVVLQLPELDSGEPLVRHSPHHPFHLLRFHYPLGGFSLFCSRVFFFFLWRGTEGDHLGGVSDTLVEIMV